MTPKIALKHDISDVRKRIIETRTALRGLSIRSVSGVDPSSPDWSEWRAFQRVVQAVSDSYESWEHQASVLWSDTGTLTEPNGANAQATGSTSVVTSVKTSSDSGDEWRSVEKDGGWRGVKPLAYELDGERHFLRLAQWKLLLKEIILRLGRTDQRARLRPLELDRKGRADLQQLFKEEEPTFLVGLNLNAEDSVAQLRRVLAAYGVLEKFRVLVRKVQIG